MQLWAATLGTIRYAVDTCFWWKQVISPFCCENELFNTTESSDIHEAVVFFPKSMRFPCRFLTSPFVIGVGGGTASGKSSVCQKIMERLSAEHQRLVAMISQDSFYRQLTTDERKKAFEGEYNFDHPDAIDFRAMRSVICDLKQGKSVAVPKYDFRTHSRLMNGMIMIEPVDVLLVEGILVLYCTEIRRVLDMKLFVDTDPDTRLSRRVIRDITERGRDLELILYQYLHYVKPAYEEFCLPTKKYADVIIPSCTNNSVAVELIVQHIQEILRSPDSASGKQGERSRHISESFVIRPH